MSLRCLIVDDNASFLEAARAVLEGQGIAVVGVATTAAQGLRLSKALHPDVVLVDIDLGPDSGLELVRKLVDGAEPAARSDVILTSAYPEEDFADLIAESAAIGFVAKSDLSAVAIQQLLRTSGGAPDEEH